MMATNEGESSDDSHNNVLRESPRVVIIGAGLTGIATADILQRAGLTDYVVLEATDRVGGRIWSIDVGDPANGVKAELGANWIHGIDKNPIFTIARKNNLLPPQNIHRKLGQKAMFLTERGTPVNTKIVQEIDWTYGMLMQQCEDFYQMGLPIEEENDSVGAYIKRHFEEKFSKYHGQDRKTREMVLENRLLGEAVIAGAHSMNDISLSQFGSFEEIAGVHYIIMPGFEAVIDVLRQSVPNEKILLEHSVTQICWDSSFNHDNRVYNISVECQNGAKFYADHVVVTVPLGYLKKHSGRLFHPPLPEFKQHAIDRVAFGVVNKVILEFEGRVLPKNICRLEMVWDRSQVEYEDLFDSWVKKIGSFEAICENVLVGWLCGREAEFMEMLSDEEIGKKCTDVLKSFLKTEIPPLKRIIRTKWKSNQYTLGSYCYIPNGSSNEDIEGLAEPLEGKLEKPQIMFAGEATHPTYYSSSHGALLSARREAQRILDYNSH